MSLVADDIVIITRQQVGLASLCGWNKKRFLARFLFVLFVQTELIDFNRVTKRFFMSALTADWKMNCNHWI